MWLWTFLSIVFFPNDRQSFRVFNEVSGGFHWPPTERKTVSELHFSFLHVLIDLKMIRWKESQTKTHVAGQHLCLSHIWSKRNDCRDSCPYFRAGDFHRSYRTSRLFLRSLVKGCFASQLQGCTGLHSDSPADTSNPSLDIRTLRNYQKQETRPPSEGCWRIIFTRENKFPSDRHKSTSCPASSLVLH